MSQPRTDLEAVARLLDGAIERGAFPCAVAEIGTPAGSVFQHATGRLAGDGDSPPASPETVFDLASLTKVMATATLCLRTERRWPGFLESRVSSHLPEWRGRDRDHVTVADLLAHQSGLTAHLPYFRDCEGREEYRHAIATQALEYPPRRQSVYSDLGFILLGFVLEQQEGLRLDGLFEAMRVELALGELTFRPPASWGPRIAPTGFSEWRGRTLLGEVHDDNCWALGGVAGHAGLFGTAASVGRFARAWLEALTGPGTAVLGARELARRFVARVGTPGSSRALGWDTMLPTSSCGPALSGSAIGHTGYTGTSLWIDWERDAYFVLLTNRVHPAAGNDAIRRVRPAFHTAAVAALDALRSRRR
jgi:CubicO group peptidase (beta-lactamase class C family)